MLPSTESCSWAFLTAASLLQLNVALLPLFVLQVTVDNEESDESYESTWSYMRHIQSDALVGHDRRTFHRELTDNKVVMSPDLPYKSF